MSYHTIKPATLFQVLIYTCIFYHANKYVLHAVTTLLISGCQGNCDIASAR